MIAVISIRTARNLIAIAALAAVTSASAHPIDPVPQADTTLQAEIGAFRKDFQAAGANRDAAALRRFYTDDFTHTHTSGKVDGKDARIVSVLAREQTVEMAPVPEFRLSCLASRLASPGPSVPSSGHRNGKWFDVRWTQTYVKTSKGWQIAISQATGLTGTVRDTP